MAALYVELRRWHKGNPEALHFGPFTEITYGGFEEADLICDGQKLFEHVRQFSAIALRGADKPDGEPDLWDMALITAS